MLITGLLVGSGGLLLGLRLYQQTRKSIPLIDKLSFEKKGEPEPWLTNKRLKLGVLIGGGLALIGGAWWWANVHGLTPLVLTNDLIEFLRDKPYSPLLYIAAYSTRPLILFSAALMTVAGGLLFGPVNGIIYTFIGSNLSALVAYGIGRQIGRTGQSTDQEGNKADQQDPFPGWQTIEPYVERMKTHPFSTILTMRFIFLPYDWVNYGAGILGLDWKPFLLATALGSLPGTVSFALAGASIQGSTITGIPSLNPMMLVASGIIFVGSLTLSRYVNRRQPRLMDVASESMIIQSGVA